MKTVCFTHWSREKFKKKYKTAILASVNEQNKIFNLKKNMFLENILYGL